MRLPTKQRAVVAVFDETTVGCRSISDGRRRLRQQPNLVVLDNRHVDVTADDAAVSSSQ